MRVNRSILVISTFAESRRWFRTSLYGLWIVLLINILVFAAVAGRGQNGPDAARSLQMNERAAVHFKAGQFEEAAVCLQEAIRLQPSYSTAYGNLGETLYRLGRLEEALAAFGRATFLEPANSLYHNNVGVILGELGRTADAIVAFERALKIDQVAPYYYNMGVMFVRMGDTEHGLPYLEKAAMIEPSNASLRLELGYAYVRLSKYARAISELKATVRLDPTNADARFVLAKLYLKQNMRQQAISEYTWLERAGSPLAEKIYAELLRGRVIRAPRKD